jgi:hypothetical protein
MFSRFIIWILLVLVPFQSFAAVGLIQCPPGRAIMRHVHHTSASKIDHRPASNPVGIVSHHSDHDAFILKVIHTQGDAGHHHSHKLPCCSDGAIIFSPNVPLPFESERFSAAVNPEPVGLTSVYLEGPKRPPRLILN